MEVTSCPLPPSKELAEYEQTLPGAADRILRMAEDSLHSEIDSQKRVVEIYADDRKAENWVYICAVVFFALGMNPAAFISFAGSVGFVMPRIIEAFKSGKASKGDDKHKSAN